VARLEQRVHERGGSAADVDDRRIEVGSNAANEVQRDRGFALKPTELSGCTVTMDTLPMLAGLHDRRYRCGAWAAMRPECSEAGVAQDRRSTLGSTRGRTCIWYSPLKCTSRATDSRISGS